MHTRHIRILYVLLGLNFGFLTYLAGMDNKVTSAPAQSNEQLLSSIAESIDSLQTQLLHLQAASKSHSSQAAMITPNKDLESLKTELAELREQIEAPEYTRHTSAQNGPEHNQPGQERFAASLKDAHASAVTTHNYAAGIKRDFRDSPNISMAHREQLENVSSIFDSNDLNGLSFGRADCVEHICRIEYSQDSLLSGLDAEILENELLLELGKFYGSGTEFISEGTAANKTIYIRLTSLDG